MITIIYVAVMYLLKLLTYAIVISAIISTLLSFGVLDSRNRIVWSIADFLHRVTEPVLRPIRRIMPATGNIDFTPWVALLLIQLVIAPLVERIYTALTAGTMQPLVY